MKRSYRNLLDCLFVFSPSGENTNNYFFFHIGSASIISFLRHNGYSAEQFICTELINLENCVRKILAVKARVVGFTTYNTNILTSVLIAEQIKKASPETIIVFGGPTATNYSEFLLNKYRFVDVCFRNESEETFLQFISQLSDSNFDLKKAGLGSIDGISYKGGDKIYNNPDSNILINNSGVADYLDKYPSPYLTGIIPGPAAFSIGLITARGCNQNCTYCNCAVLSKRRFFTQSVERIIGEIDFISKCSSNNGILNIFDDAFSLIPQRAKNICRAIIENKIKISLSCTTRCDCVDEELLDLLKEAGFVSIGFSLESANPETLRIIGKVHKAEDIPSDDLKKEILFIEKLGTVSSYAKKIGIKYVFTSIMAGLPNETIDEANKTIETIDKNADIDFYSHNFLNIYKGTPLYSTYQRYGYKVEFIDDNPIFSTTIYPEDVYKKVNILPKSNIIRAQAENRKNTLKVLSLAPEEINADGWVNNVILLSEIIDKHFVIWLQKILAINGRIIHIYSSKEALAGHSKNNYKQFVKYSAPSLRILNYYVENDKNLSFLISHNSFIHNLKGDEGDIAISDFGYVESNLKNPDIDFLRLLCKESDSDDARSAHNYYCSASKEKNVFGSLVNSRPYPYFANICKWTNSITNCQKRNTLIIDDRSNVRLCWFGRNIGKVGQSYSEIFGECGSYQEKVTHLRKCNNCRAREYCNKCISPYPFSDKEFCREQKKKNITKTAELFMIFDLFKKYM